MAVVRSIRSPVSTATDLTPILDSLTTFGEKAQNRFRQEAAVKLQDEATRKASTAIAAGEPIPAPKEQGLFSSPLVDVYNKALQDVYLVDAVNKYETDLGRYRTELDNRPAVDENGQPLDKTADMHAYASQSREALTKALEENGLTAGVATEFQRVSLNSLQRHLGAMQDKAVQASYAYAQDAAEMSALALEANFADQVLSEFSSLDDLIYDRVQVEVALGSAIAAKREIIQTYLRTFPGSEKLKSIRDNLNDTVIKDLMGRAAQVWRTSDSGIRKLNQLHQILLDGGYYEDNQQPAIYVADATRDYEGSMKEMLDRHIAELSSGRAGVVQTVLGNDVTPTDRWEMTSTIQETRENPYLSEKLKQEATFAMWQEAYILREGLGRDLPADHPMREMNLRDSQAILGSRVDDAEKLMRKWDAIRSDPDQMRFELADIKARVDGPRVDQSRLLTLLDTDMGAGLQELSVSVMAAMSAPDAAYTEMTGQKPTVAKPGMSSVDKANMGSFFGTLYSRYAEATPDERRKYGSQLVAAVTQYVSTAASADTSHIVAPFRRLVLKDNPTMTSDQAALLDTVADLAAAGDVDAINTLLDFSSANPPELPELDKLKADIQWFTMSKGIQAASSALNFGAVNASADLESTLRTAFYNMVAMQVPDAKSRISRIVNALTQSNSTTRVIEGEALNRKAYVRIPVLMGERGEQFVSRMMRNPSRPWMAPDQQARLGQTSQILFVTDGYALALHERAQNGTTTPITLSRDVADGEVLLGGGTTDVGGAADTLWYGSNLKYRKAGDPVVVVPTLRGP